MYCFPLPPIRPRIAPMPFSEREAGQTFGFRKQPESSWLKFPLTQETDFTCPVCLIPLVNQG